jgi:hypothetical protein
MVKKNLCFIFFIFLIIILFNSYLYFRISNKSENNLNIEILKKKYEKLNKEHLEYKEYAQSSVKEINKKLKNSLKNLKDCENLKKNEKKLNDDKKNLNVDENLNDKKNLNCLQIKNNLKKLQENSKDTIPKIIHYISFENKDGPTRSFPKEFIKVCKLMNPSKIFKTLILLIKVGKLKFGKIIKIINF